MKLKTMILCTALSGALMAPAIANAEDTAAAETPSVVEKTVEAVKEAKEGIAEKMEHKGPAKGEKMFEEADTNKDGKLSKEEFLARHDKKFTEIDANKDGFLAPDEMKSYGETMREKFHERMKERKEKMMERKEGKEPAAH